MPATADYLAVHPFAPPDIVNPPDAPLYRYRPDITELTGTGSLEELTTEGLGLGSRVDIIRDNMLESWVLYPSATPGASLEVVPDDYDALTNNVHWVLVASSSTGLGTLSFADITGTISIDQLPPGSLVSLDSIGEDALYFLNNTTGLPELISADSTVAFLSGHINFSDLFGTIAFDQFPDGVITTLDSIDEDAVYFFDNDLFEPELLGADGVAAFLSGHIAFSDISGTLTLAQLPSGTAATVDTIDEDAFFFFNNTTGLPELLSIADTVTALGISGGTGDVVGPSSSIDAEVVLFNSTTGKLIKRATGSGLAILTSGVLSTTTDNSSNWDTAYTDRLKWDGGATGLTAATGRTSLGLGTLATQSGTFSGTSSGTNTGDQDLSGLQPLDSDLTTIAGLTATTDNFIVSVSSAWASRTPTQVKSTLGLVIGTNVQAWDADLDALAALSGTNNIYYRSASNTWSSVTIGSGLTFSGGSLDATGGAGTVTHTGGNLTSNSVVLGAGSADTKVVAGFTTDGTSKLKLGSSGATGILELDNTLSSNGASIYPTNDSTAALYVNKADNSTHVLVIDTTNKYLGIGTSPSFALDVSGTGRVSSSFYVGGISSGLFVETSTGGQLIGRTASQTRSDLALVIGTNVQAWDADLDTLAGLTATTDNFIVSVSSAWASRTPTQVKTTLGLTIGTNVQAWDADLDTLAGLTATTDNFIVSVSSAWASRTPSQVRTTLGLVIGTNVQAWDADLDTLAGLTATTDNFVVSVSSAWASRTPAQVRTTLGLVIGTNVQAWDADLDTWAGITPASGVGTFLATPSSANLLAAMTDETGTGACVFATTPTLTTPHLAAGGSGGAPLSMTSGTVASSPVAGDIEYDGLVHYSTHATSERGVAVSRQFIRLTSTYTLASQTAAQKMFNSPTNGAITVAANATYRFKCEFSVTSLSSTSGQIGFALAGTANQTSIAWFGYAAKPSSVTSTANAPSFIFNTTNANTAITSANVNTAAIVSISGIVTITTGGTLIPQISMTQAAAAVMGVNSIFEVEPIGSNTVQSVGNWS